MGYSNITVNHIDYNKVYTTRNYGNFIFLEEVEPLGTYDENGKKIRQERRARVRFLDTGYEPIVLVRDAIRGVIKDKYRRIIYGVACVGDTYTNGDHRKAYSLWKSMIDRCYNHHHVRNYEHCFVCLRWLIFENFLEDLPKIPHYQDWLNSTEETYSLDKDYLQPNMPVKVYSPDTCIFMPLVDNQRLAMIQSKHTRANKYYGVYYDRGGYKVSNTIRTCYDTPVGYFDDEVAAVNMREYHRIMTHNPSIPNENYPKMDVLEALSHKRPKKPLKQLYEVVDPSKG